jgi:putative glutamine amidotransferase
MPIVPRIGLTMRLELETNRFYLGRHYCEALEYFGAVPLHIPLIPKRDWIRALVETLDGILLPGSDTDLDPHYYGEDPHPKLKKVVPEKDLTDILILEEAERAKLPVLAICYGMQALNVHYGGSLFQDIDSQIENPIKHDQGPPLGRVSHKIKVKDESRLSNITKNLNLNGDIKVNSHHHQSIKNVGNTLTATAWTNDGVIECVEGKDAERFILGVQWHPEISFESDELSREIFKEFVNECGIYASRKKR